MGPAKEFPSFPLLPLELRLNIWRIAAASHTRIIPFHADPNDPYVFTYEYTPITLLSVSHEARIQTLKSYTKVQGVGEEDDDYDDGYGNGNGNAIFPPIYFNPLRDEIGGNDHMSLRGMYRLAAGFERYGICAGIRDINNDQPPDSWAHHFSKRGYIYKPATEKIAYAGELEPAGNRGFWWKGVTIGEGDVWNIYGRGISVV